MDHFINALNLVVNVYQTRCEERVPGSKRPIGINPEYLYSLHDNKDFGALIGNFASPDAHAVFGTVVSYCGIECYQRPPRDLQSLVLSILVYSPRIYPIFGCYDTRSKS